MIADGTRLTRALDVIMERCLGVGAGESVLVIGDADSRELAAAMADAAGRHGGRAVLALFDAGGGGDPDPPPPLAAALAATDVYLAPTTHTSLSHTPARRAATAAGARGASLPGVTADMLARLMSVDFDALVERSRTVADLLSAASSAHVSCPRGTDLTLDLTGREGLLDIGELTARGAFGNLPSGEGYIAPLGGNGRIAASSFGSGVVPEGALFSVEDGLLTDASGPHAQTFRDLLLAHGPLGANLAELGVGTNDAATVTGNVLEDEKTLGTIHIAFGASASFGGTVSVPVHRDMVVVDPTLEIGGTRVLDRGAWLL